MKSRYICMMMILLARVVFAGPAVIYTPLQGALAKVDEIPDPFFKAQTITEMAEKYALTQQRDQCYRLLRHARESAAIIGPPHDRAWAVANIGAVYTEAGNVTRGLVFFSRAHRIAVESGVRVGLSSLLTQIACLCAKSGHSDRALRIADDIDDFWGRSLAVAAVCRALIEEGECDRAERIMEQLVGAPQRSFVQAEVAQALGRAGAFSRAVVLALALEDPLQRAKAVSDVADSAVEAGEFDLARDILRKLDGKSDGPQALYKAGGLILVSAAYEREGLKAKAFTTLSEARRAALKAASWTRKAKALADVAGALEEQGGPLRASWILDSAVSIASKVPSAARRAETLAWIAQRCVRSSMPSEARALLVRAQAWARKTRNCHGDRDSVLAEICRGWLLLYRYDQVNRILKTIRSGRVRVKILVDYCKAAMEDRKWDIAFNSARTIKFRESGNADRPLAEIAAIYTKAGMYETALRIIRWIDSIPLRAVALAELDAMFRREGHNATDIELAHIRYISEPITMVTRPVMYSMDVRPPLPGLYIVQRRDEHGPAPLGVEGR